MYSLAISRFDIPGEAGFPLNGVYGRPRTPEEADILRQYFLQLRHETGNRLCDRVSWAVFNARIFYLHSVMALVEIASCFNLRVLGLFPQGEAKTPNCNTI